ncbi:unnamed protein product, partial [Timema podura]|nr:unnamed protein product [Timema podura]
VYISLLTVADVNIELVDVLNSNGHKYSVYKGLVSWDTAVAICREKSEYLVAPTDLQEVRFLSRALASSHLGIKYVWLSGRMERGGWVWSMTGDLMPMEIQDDGYPPWIIEEQEKGDCLVLDASVQDKPYFSGINCTNLHSFICEQDTQSNKHVFTLHGYEYLFFSEKLSWPQASLACESENAKLAAIEDRNTVLFVAKNMVKAMEVPHALWLGAHRNTDGTWEWILNGEELSARNNYERGYPIWADSPEDKGWDCLSFETATSARKRSYFVQKHCDTAQAYLCQR